MGQPLGLIVKDKPEVLVQKKWVLHGVMGPLLQVSIT